MSSFLKPSQIPELGNLNVLNTLWFIRQSLINLFSQIPSHISYVPIPGLSSGNTERNMGLPLVQCELYYEKKWSSANLLLVPRALHYRVPIILSLLFSVDCYYYVPLSFQIIVAVSTSRSIFLICLHQPVSFHTAIYKIDQKEHSWLKQGYRVPFVWNPGTLSPAGRRQGKPWSWAASGGAMEEGCLHLRVPPPPLRFCMCLAEQQCCIGLSRPGGFCQETRWGKSSLMIFNIYD